MDEQQSRTLASQLSRPNGAQGNEIAGEMHEHNGPMSRHAIDLLNIQEGERILEIGPANGGHAAYALEKASKTSYEGIDISQDMVNLANELNANLVQAGLAKFIKGDGVQLPYEENYFNKVFTVNTLYFWTDYAKQLAEVHRVLKAGGYFNIAIRSRSFMQGLPFTRYGFQMFEVPDVVNLLSDNGFKTIHVAVAEEVGTGNHRQVIKKDRIIIVATPIQ